MSGMKFQRVIEVIIVYPNFVLVLWAKNEDFKEKFFDKQKELEKYLGEEIAKNNSVMNRSQIKRIRPTNSPTLEAMFNDLIIPTKRKIQALSDNPLRW